MRCALITPWLSQCLTVLTCRCSIWATSLVVNKIGKSLLCSMSSFKSHISAPSPRRSSYRQTWSHKGTFFISISLTPFILFWLLWCLTLLKAKRAPATALTSGYSALVASSSSLFRFFLRLVHMLGLECSSFMKICQYFFIIKWKYFLKYVVLPWWFVNTLKRKDCSIIQRTFCYF